MHNENIEVAHSGDVITFLCRCHHYRINNRLSTSRIFSAGKWLEKERFATQFNPLSASH